MIVECGDMILHHIYLRIFTGAYDYLEKCCPVLIANSPQEFYMLASNSCLNISALSVLQKNNTQTN